MLRWGTSETEKSNMIYTSSVNIAIQTDTGNFILVLYVTTEVLTVILQHKTLLEQGTQYSDYD